MLTGDPNGTRTGAVGLTEHSERRDHNVNKLITIPVSQRLDSLMDVAQESESFRGPQGQVQHAPPPQMRERSRVFWHSS